MNFEEFIEELQEQIQERFLQHIEFVSKMVNATNEKAEGESPVSDNRQVGEAAPE